MRDGRLELELKAWKEGVGLGEYCRRWPSRANARRAMGGQFRGTLKLLQVFGDGWTGEAIVYLLELCFKKNRMRDQKELRFCPELKGELVQPVAQSNG